MPIGHQRAGEGALAHILILNTQLTKNNYAIHRVNNGATREAVLTGLPQTVKELRIYTTNPKRAMSEGKPVVVSKGEARFTIEAAGFTSLISSQ